MNSINNQPMKQPVKSSSTISRVSNMFQPFLGVALSRNPWFWGTPMDLSFAFGWTFAHQTFGGRPFPRSFRHVGPGDKLRSMCQWMSVLSIFRFQLHDDMVVLVVFTDQTFLNMIRRLRNLGSAVGTRLSE